MTRAPIVVVAPPASGARLVAAALGAAPGVRRLEGAASFVDRVPGLGLADRGFDGHHLTAEDARGRHADVAAALEAVLPRGTAPAVRPLLAGPRYALRVGLVAAVFPAARFVLVEPDGAALGRATARWRDGATSRTVDPPGWSGPPWTFPIIPGWRALDGLPLERIASQQWETIDKLLLADLQALAPDRWCAVSRRELVARPGAELERLAACLGIVTHPAMTVVVEAASGGSAGAVPAPAVARLDELVAGGARRRRAPRTRGVHSLRFARLLDRLDGSLLLTAPGTASLVIVQARNDELLTATYPMAGATGVATAGDEVLLAAGSEVWRLHAVDDRLVPGARLPAPGTVLGDVALADGAPWAVVDAPWRGLGRCDPAAGMRARWRDPGGDGRLGGLAVDGDQVRWLTTLDGRVLEHPTGATVAAGLNLPRSPRLHAGRLWLVEPDTLTAVDPSSGAVERAVAVPGARGGLDITAGVALLGGVRNGSGTVWAVDLDRRAVLGFVRLAPGSGPVAGVAVLAGRRSPTLDLSGGLPVRGAPACDALRPVRHPRVG